MYVCLHYFGALQFQRPYHILLFSLIEDATTVEMYYTGLATTLQPPDTSVQTVPCMLIL